MLSLDLDREEMEAQLADGGLDCPDCGDQLRPWGHARPRVVRRFGREERIRPRRTRCDGCETTHVLLPSTVLARRRDHIDVIGVALACRARGLGYRKIAARTGVPLFTARSWLRRFRDRAPEIHSEFDGDRVVDLDWASASETPERSAVTAITRANAAAGRSLHEIWAFASVATQGHLLANTSSPLCGNVASLQRGPRCREHPEDTTSVGQSRAA